MADLVNAGVLGALTGGGGGGIVFPIVLIPTYAVPRAFLVHSYSLIVPISQCWGMLLMIARKRPGEKKEVASGKGRQQRKGDAGGIGAEDVVCGQQHDAEGGNNFDGSNLGRTHNAAGNNSVFAYAWFAF
jgi:hypothetical protein